MHMIEFFTFLTEVFVGSLLVMSILCFLYCKKEK